MDTATQYYEINQEFQLCTVAQLEKFSSEYSWPGRHLTSWTDEEGVMHDVDGVVSFGRGNANVSGDWVLDKIAVSAFVPSGHGKVSVSAYNNQPPLPEPVSKTADIGDREQTEIYYGSMLSVSCVPDEGYRTTAFKVNEYTPGTGNVCVRDNVTSTYGISAFFDEDSAADGVLLFGKTLTTEGGVPISAKVPYGRISQPFAYVAGSKRVQEPFFTQTDFKNAGYLYSIEDPLSAVVSVAADGFRGCSSLSSASLPAVTEIGACAFYDATLKDADFPGISVVRQGTFYNNDLTSVNLPNVVEIEDCPGQTSGSFRSNEKLSSIDLPRAKYVGDYAFYQTNLTSISCPEASAFGKYVFYSNEFQKIDLPNVLSVGKGCFCICTRLSSVNAENLVCIDGTRFEYEGAFEKCRSLSAAYFPNATYVGPRAFYQCSSMICANISSATSIGEKTFYGCKKLSSIDLPRISSIGPRAFYDCDSLELITLSANQNLVAVQPDAFDGTTHRPVSVDVKYDLLGSYLADATWAGLTSTSKVTLVAAVPTVDLLQEDGSHVYLDGNDIERDSVARFADTTVAATIGYPKDGE